jgi:uncharacterized coiled-coil protein SlyX
MNKLLAFLASITDGKAPEMPVLAAAGGDEVEILSTLDHVYNVRVHARAGLARGKEHEEKIRLKAESVSTADDADWLKEARAAIGLPESHPNMLFFSCVATHADKVLATEHSDILPKGEVEAALPSLLLQPVDVQYYYDWWFDETTALNAHERERLTGVNGIRGVIYAAKLVDDAVHLGIALWAVDFPDVAALIVEDQEFIGASVDLLAAGYNFDSEKHRLLSGLNFLGCAILYRHKAADRGTSIGNLEYMGDPLDLESIASTAQRSGVPLIVLPTGRIGTLSSGANEAATPVTAAAAVGAQTSAKEGTDMTLEELQKKVDELDSQIASQAGVIAERDATIAELQKQAAEQQTEIDRITGELTTVTAAKEKAEGDLSTYLAAQAAREISETRMGELLEIGPLADGTDATVLAERLGTMDESEWKITKLEHENATLKAGTTVTAQRQQTQVQAQASNRRSSFGSANAGGSTEGLDNPRALGRSIAQTLNKVG